MFVQATLGDTDGFGDIVHGHQVEAFLGQELVDGIEDRFFASFKLLFSKGKF